MKQIETERLIMREFELADAEGLFELDSDHSFGLPKKIATTLLQWLLYLYVPSLSLIN